MSKVTYAVVCPHDKFHKLPVVLDVKDNSKGVESTFEVYCPFCDRYVRVKIDKQQEPDVDTYRRFGFRND